MLSHGFWLVWSIDEVFEFACKRHMNSNTLCLPVRTPQRAEKPQRTVQTQTPGEVYEIPDRCQGQPFPRLQKCRDIKEKLSDMKFNNLPS